MSVTFSVLANDRIVTPEGWKQEYEHDELYGDIPTNQNPLEMNVANGNYARIMRLIGMDAPEGTDPFQTYGSGRWGDGSLQHVYDAIQTVLEGIAAMPTLDGGVAGDQYKGEGGALIEVIYG
jgi:hypothetical protein